MILILSNEQDAHAKKVIFFLKERNERFLVFDTSEFPINSQISIDYESLNPKLIYLNKEYRFDEITSIWWRRPQLFKVHPTIPSQEYQAFAYAEITEAFEGLWQITEAFWLNEPNKDLIASRKVFQLKLAKQIGLKIPQTLITNNPKDAIAFIEKTHYSKTVYKPFKGSLKVWRETRVLKKEELNLIDNVKFAPLIFQEYIEAEADLRITIVGDKIFPAAIYSKESNYPQDFRMDLNNSSIKPITIPDEISKKLFELMRKLDIRYGAIDMRLTPQGEYIFLEINPAGQWLFVEEATKQPISNEVANVLIQGKK